MKVKILFVALIFSLVSICTTNDGIAQDKKFNSWHDSSPHSVQLVKVGSDVHLEVLDWGGSGTPLVLLAGLGDTAHVFDDFAPKLISNYGICQ